MYLKARRILRNTALDVLGIFAKPAKGIHILNGHFINQKNASIDIFLEQLNELQKISSFVRIEEAIDLIYNNKNVNDVLVAFTFDDGFEECASMIAPALEAFGINGMFFINPNFVDGDNKYIVNFTENVVMTSGKKPMRWNNIIKLHQTGHIIGAHTLDHRMCSNDNLNELEYQIGECKKRIENNLHSQCEHFAFPYGKLEHINSLSINIASKY